MTYRDLFITVDITAEDKRMVKERLKVIRKEDLSVEMVEMVEELPERLKSPRLKKLPLKLRLK